MVAEKNQYMSKAAEEMYAKNADEIIREQCRVREENLAYEQYVQEQLEQAEVLKKELEAKNQELKAKDQELKAKNQELKAKDQQLNAKNQTIAKMTQERVEDKKYITELQSKRSNQ